MREVNGNLVAWLPCGMVRVIHADGVSRHYLTMDQAMAACEPEGIDLSDEGQAEFRRASEEYAREVLPE